MPKFQNNYENTPFDEEDNRLNGNGKNDFSRIPLSTEQGPKSDGAMQYKSDSGESDHLKNFLISYAFASLATLIKTIAWWFNQWPIMKGNGFFIKWISSASIAGCEYLPMTFAFQFASSHNVHLSLMTAYMEASDNFFRMLQQYVLGDPLRWFDWFAALLLGLCVVFQGTFHFLMERQRQDGMIPAESAPDTSGLGRGLKYSFVVLFVGSILGSTFGGYLGQAYSLATIATAAKTFAWWINQYPALKDLSFIRKWLAGWSIAATLEYLPLIGAFTVASQHQVHLGLMTAYMEALDNAFRIIQQYFLGKPLYWFDYTAAFGMFLAVLFQGVMNYNYIHSIGM